MTCTCAPPSVFPGVLGEAEALADRDGDSETDAEGLTDADGLGDSDTDGDAEADGELTVSSNAISSAYGWVFVHVVDAQVSLVSVAMRV